jgi:hypothetical protein
MPTGQDAMSPVISACDDANTLAAHAAIMNAPMTTMVVPAMNLPRFAMGIILLFFRIFAIFFNSILLIQQSFQ